MEGKRGLIPVVGGEPPAEVGRGGSPPDKHECSEVLDCDEDLLVDLLAGVALRGPDCTLDFLELAMIFYTGAFSAKSQKGAWLWSISVFSRFGLESKAKILRLSTQHYRAA